MATQKKTADVDYSMQEKIIALYELQKIDSKIDEINTVKIGYTVKNFVLITPVGNIIHRPSLSV